MYFLVLLLKNHHHILDFKVESGVNHAAEAGFSVLLPFIS
jgi:hypothetical protein